MTTTIELNGMRFYAYHGVLLQEQRVGNWYSVDLSLRIDVRKAIETDHLDDTINYAEVYNEVQQAMEQPSQLLEHVAGRIYHRLKAVFPTIEKLRIKITKEQPPFKGELVGASVILED